MKERRIHALLFTDLKDALHFGRPDSFKPGDEHEVVEQYMTRGATCAFLFDFSTKGYSFSDVSQLEFIFSQNNILTTYEMYDEDHNMNPNFSISNFFINAQGQLDGQVLVTLKLDPEDTLAFKATTKTKVKCEVMIKLDTDGEGSSLGDTTIIETMPDVNVIDSLASKLMSVGE